MMATLCDRLKALSNLQADELQELIESLQVIAAASTGTTN